MKLSGFLAFTLLSISILSFGLTGAVNAQENLPLSVNTDASAYTTGNSITVSGTVKTLSEFEQPVVVIVTNPSGTWVVIDQIIPDDQGNYSMTFTSGGKLMSSSGEYSIQASYGAQKITGTFDFLTADTPKTTPEPTPQPEPSPEPTPEPEPIVEQVVNCGPGTESVNGVCQVIKAAEPEEEEGGGCLIATATYGSELAPQVQMLSCLLYTSDAADE